MAGGTTNVYGGSLDGDVYDIEVWVAGTVVRLRGDVQLLNSTTNINNTAVIEGWATDADGDFVAIDGTDIYPSADEVGLFERLNIWLSPEDHFNSFSGWSWDAVNFSGTPNTINVATYGSIAMIYDNAAGTDFFAYKTLASTSTVEMAARCAISSLGASYAYAGIRFDNPSSPTNNFVEVRMLPGTATGFMKLTVRYDNGGGVTSTDYADGLPAGFYVLRLAYLDASNVGAVYYTKDGPRVSFLVDAGSTWSSATIRAGLILGQVAAVGSTDRCALFDWWFDNQ
jgi:hypothetical protein